MRLLYVTPLDFSTDLYSSAWISRAKALSDKGWEIAFVAPNSTKSREKVEESQFKFFGINRIGIIGLRGVSWEYSVSTNLQKIIEEFEPDVVISDWNGANGTNSVANRMQVPWVFDDHSPPANKGMFGRLQWSHYRRSWTHAAPKASGVVVLTPSLEKLVRTKYEFDSEIITCQSGVDTSLFFDGEKAQSPIKLAYHGSLTKERGVLNLIDVVRNLTEEGFDVNLRVFGRGPCLENFISAGKNHLPIEAHGPVDFNKVPSILSECHIGLLPWPDQPSWNTSSPIKLFEYAASGMAIVGTNVQAHLDMGERDWLLLADKSNISYSMTKSLVDIISEGRMSELGLSARDSAEKEFQWSSVVSDFDHLLKKIISRSN